jgi:hypothetical protein
MSEFSMSSEEEQDPIMLDENADALLSLMDGIVDDIPLVEKKLAVVCDEIYGHTVRPRASPMSAVWELLKLPATMHYDALLERLFLSAERLDVPARTIHFGNDLALLFGRSSLTLFEFTELLIDSLEFSSPNKNQRDQL